ncbi:MAG: hypothetical protein KY476_26870, partial [Planctomycetes bacterium]|nr:hypothetical protein [Planctomycetota bacterium]
MACGALLWTLTSAAVAQDAAVPEVPEPVPSLDPLPRLVGPGDLGPGALTGSDPFADERSGSGTADEPQRGLTPSAATDDYRPVPVLKRIAQNDAPLRDDDAAQDSEMARGPYGTTSGELNKITEIQPFADYEPDPEVRREDPCRYLCPRPDIPACRVGDGEGAGGRRCPEEVSLSDEPWQPRLMPESLFTWEASNIYYNPLYFEDPQLERYGHTYHHLVQPFASTARFSQQLLGLPYQMTINPVWRKKYPLGWYRPGEPAPRQHYPPLPWHPNAVCNQAAVMTGLIFL